MRLSLIILLSCMALLGGCSRQQIAVEVPENTPFREGDLVLRCGWGYQSRVVTQSSASLYSHIGILHYDSLDQQWQVVHAVPNEAPQTEPDYLKAEPIEVFFAPDRASRGAWMRIDCNDSVAQAATRYALRKVSDRVVFDDHYRLSDTTRMYCTELVWQAYLHQGIDISSGSRHQVPDLFSKDGSCIYPLDIEKSVTTLFVKPFNTKLL